MEISVGNDVYSFIKFHKIQITDTTINKCPNSGRYLIQNWALNCNDKKNKGKIQNFIKSTKTNETTGYIGATSLPPTGDSFMYIETSSKSHGNKVFISFERTDIIQNSNITFCYNRCSILTNDSLKAMGRFRIQLLLEDNTWSTRYNIPKSDRCRSSPTQWTKSGLIFTVENYGIKLTYDAIGTAYAKMCFNIITRTHFVY